MLLGPTSATAISLYPHPDLRSLWVPVAKEGSRAIDGTFHQAREPKYGRWDFTVGFVPASDAALVQSWWTTGASILLWPDEILWPNSAYPVAFGNPTIPLDQWTFPYYGTRARGKISLQTRSAY